jgi:hypothetical protein
VKLPLKQARIIQAADAVAYLPLYVAEDQQYELIRKQKPNLLWTEAFGEPARSPPAEYVSHIRAAIHRGGDLGCLHAVVKAWDDDKQPLIGICDPIEIEKWGYESKLAIVGGFIRRACFWCLTDKASKAEDLSGLDIESLFIHDAGFSTGHAIGEQIASEMRKQFDTVPGSFELLVDGAVWQKKKDPDKKLAAISASILSCVIASAREDLKVAFPLHKDDRYSEFLSTAIVVPRQCLEDEDFRDALTLLILAIQEAVNYLEKTNLQGKLKLMGLVNDDGRFAQERMIDSAEVVDSKVVPLRTGTGGTAEGNLAKVTEDDAKEIYKSLIDADLYARDGRIEAHEWENAWRTRSSKTAPSLTRFFDSRILDQASKSRIRGGTAARPTRTRFLVTLLVFAAALSAVVGLQSLGVVPPRGTLFLIFAAGGLALLIEFRSAVDHLLHWLVRSTWLRSLVVGIALLLGATIAVINLGNILIALTTLFNDDALKPEFVANAPPALASFWLTWAPKISLEWHLIFVACTALLGVAWSCAGLTPLGRRARPLFGLFGREPAREAS